MLERNAEAGRKILISGGTRWCAAPPRPAHNRKLLRHPVGWQTPQHVRLQAELHACSNVLPMDVDPGRDFFTEGSPAALRGVLASWSLPDCREWCA